MKTFLKWVVAAVLGASVLVGCGDSDALSDGAESSGESSDSSSDSESGDYCSTLEGALDEFGSLEEGDFAQFDAALDSFRDLADEAPSEVEDQWGTLVDAIDELESAFEEAGLSFSDLDGLAAGEIPEGVDQEALGEALSSLDELDRAELTRAGDEIQVHGESECGVTFPE